MAAPSLIDLETPFDVTAYQTISGAQLEQLVAGTSPFTDKGLFLLTVDVGGNPTVPNATTTTKWQTYGWIRVSATLVTMYLWNPNGAVDATFLKWISINVAGIGAGSIVNAMIADNTIQSVKIVSLDYAKVTGAPANLPPSGVATGDLTGNYPNPSIAALAVTAAKIALQTITNAQIAPKTIQVSSLLGDNAAGDMMRANAADGTVVEWFAPAKTLIAQTSLETNLAASAGKVVRANIAGTGYEYGHTILQVAVDEKATVFTTNTNLNNTTAPTTGNTTLLTIFGTAGTITFTPLSSLSTLIIDVNLQLSNGTGANIMAFLFEGTNPIAGGITYVNNSCPNLTFKHKIASTGVIARTFLIYIAATAGTTQVNEQGGTAFFGGGLSSSSVQITEYL